MIDHHVLCDNCGKDVQFVDNDYFYLALSVYVRRLRKPDPHYQEPRRMPFEPLTHFCNANCLKEWLQQAAMNAVESEL